MTRTTVALAAALALPLALVVCVPSGLGADGTSSTTPTRADRALARVVAVSPGRDPRVSRSTSPRVAARIGLARYGAPLGLGDPGTRLVGARAVRSVTGDDVVRFTETREGLPVIGGSVVVDLRPDRQVASMTASVSRASVPAATYSSAQARQEALDVAEKQLGGGVSVRSDPPQHRLYDPAVLGVPRTSDPATQARGVWWVPVHAGQVFQRAILVDDRTGSVVLDLDLAEQVNRVVCNDHNFMDKLDLPCTSRFARTEHGGPSKVRDVNDAFVLAGVVSRFYRRIGGIDLTRMLGVDEGHHLSLSSTVRYCSAFLPAADCPYANAFWNGIGMFYGQGYASADDVVGHEMTHGVIQHNADLFYWGQSGAINESLADIMGEIIDHRHHGPGDSPHSWTIGEDLPSGPIRSLRKPGRFGQPDRMTGRRYAGDGDSDDGGVHTNSGIGNRTFYLISQGGKQGGETVHGIDGRSLTKTATLYLDVIQHLASGSDYADLAAVLVQSCHALARHHTVGFTRGDCRNVHRATVATRLRAAPRHAKQPRNAQMSCPNGTGSVRVLFDSETGSPQSKFDAGSTWVRAPDASAFPPVAANATSGRRSWYSAEPQDTTVSSLTMHPVALPAGRPAYLWFQQWRFLESGTNVDGTRVNYDAGTVQVADATRGQQPRPAEGLPWVNGPHDVVTDLYGNPAAGRVGFSRNSNGYLASRARLTRYAGDAVSPQFTMNTDDDSTEQGWYLDDIRVYTCSRAPVPTSTPHILGTPVVGDVLTTDAGSWSPARATRAIQWYAGGEPVPGATGASYTLTGSDLGQPITARVRATWHGRHAATSSAATSPVARG